MNAATFEERAPCGQTVAAGACDGRCSDCAEWPNVCGLHRGWRAAGAKLNVLQRYRCPDGFDGESCIGCEYLAAPEVTP